MIEEATESKGIDITVKRIDLHTHSAFSDGSCTPAELVSQAKARGVAAIALTDHDTINGIPEAKTAAEEAGLELVPGIEISAHYRNVEIHLLGLFINCENSPLTEKLPQLMQARTERNAEMIRRLSAAGAEILKENLEGDNPDATITRAHFAKALVETGFCKNPLEAFQKHLGPDCYAYVPRVHFPAEECIALIKASGGVSVLAHPTRYRQSEKEIEQMTRELADMGLTGIEGYYSTYNYHDHTRILALAKKYRLLVTGGSDFHGANKPSIALGIGQGDLFVPYSLLESLKTFLRSSSS